MGKQGQLLSAGAQSTAGRSTQLRSVRFMAAPTLNGLSPGKMRSFGTFTSSLNGIRPCFEPAFVRLINGSGFFSAISHCAILIHYFTQMDHEHLSADWSIAGPICFSNGIFIYLFRILELSIRNAEHFA
jgi:hypothetical protein